MPPDGMEVFADRLSPLKLLLDEVNIERPIMDYLAAMICDRVFERFPNLRMASIENGSGYLSGLFARLRGLDRKLPGHFSRDPVETFRRARLDQPLLGGAHRRCDRTGGARSCAVRLRLAARGGASPAHRVPRRDTTLDDGVRRRLVHDNAHALSTLRPA